MSDDTILAQILAIVQDVQSTVQGFDTRLTKTEEELISLTKRLDLALNRAFPNGDLDAHRIWHINHSLPAWRRRLIKWLE